MGFLITHTGGGSLTYKDAVRTASSANVPLTGSAPIIVGGVSLSDKDRVLLKDQGNATQNGIYTIAISGGTYTLTRSPDCNTSKEMVPNMLVPVSEGTFADRYFQLTTNAPIVLGTTALAFDFASVVDHGTLLGLGDDDHTQYLNTTRAKTWFDTDYLKQTVTNGSTATVPSEDAVFDHVTSATSNLANRSLSNLTSPTALNQVLLGQDGTVTAPAYSFTSQPGFGLYRGASNSLRLAMGGIDGFSVTGVPNGEYTLTLGNNTSFFFAQIYTGGQYTDFRGINNTGFTITNTQGIRLNASSLYYNGDGGYGSQNGGGIYFGAAPGGWGRASIIAAKVGVSVNDPTTFATQGFGMLGARGLPQYTTHPYWSTAANNTTTLVFNAGAIPSGIGNYVAIGDRVALTGLASIKATVLSITNTNTIVVDSPLGDGNVRQLIIERRLLNLYTQAGTNCFNVDYDGNTNISGELRVSANTSLNAGLTIKSRHAQTGTVTVLTSDIYIGCDSNGGAVTVNLPAASSAKAGKKLIIKDEGGFATVNNISIVGSGGDLIDGSAGQSLLVNYESITLICDGVSEWFII